MSESVICGACRARLTLPPGCTKTKARCPRCNAPVDLAATRDRSEPALLSLDDDAPLSLDDDTARPRWLYAVALALALGPAIGPVVMSRTTDPRLDLGLGLLLGFGCAWVALSA